MITLIFSTFNGCKTLPRMLESLKRLNSPVGFEILAVDNNSSDSSLDLLQKYQSDLPLRILTQPIRGKNNALNLALEQRLNDLVVFTDDDIIAPPNWLETYIECAAAKPDYDLFGGHILPHWEKVPPPWIESIALGINYALTSSDLNDGPISPKMIWGPNMMVRKKVFDAGHRFNGNIGPSSGQYIMGSETEFNIRIVNAGSKSWFCSKSKVDHIIRDFQMEYDWVVQRGYRAGRMRARSVVSDAASSGAGYPKVPAWLIRRVVQNYVVGSWFKFLGNEKEAIKSQWLLSYDKGYLSQLKAMKTDQRPGSSV